MIRAEPAVLNAVSPPVWVREKSNSPPLKGTRSVLALLHERRVYTIRLFAFVLLTSRDEYVA
jgi:hypothetical protein